MPSPSQVTGGHSGCHRPRGFPVSVGITNHQSESAHRGEPSPPEPQRKAERAGEPQMGGDFSAPTEAVGRSRPARGVPRAGRTASKHQARGQMTGGSDKGHTESLGGASPTLPWMQDIPERLRLRLGWTPRPVSGSSKPSLILLYAGKDDAGALDAYIHAYNPAFSEYIWAVDIRRKGGDLGQDMLGEEPYLTMCSMAMAGKVALVGGGPNCRTWSILNRVAHRR